MSEIDKLALLWGDQINQREKILKDIELKENNVKEKLIANVGERLRLHKKKWSGSKYANAKYAHRVAADHPWHSYSS